MQWLLPNNCIKDKTGDTTMGNWISIWIAINGLLWHFDYILDNDYDYKKKEDEAVMLDSVEEEKQFTFSSVVDILCRLPSYGL